MRVALITANYGAYDPVRDLPDDHGFDEAICVTDRADLVGKGWNTFVEHQEEPPRLAAKRPKMLPWLYTSCDAAVWLDASFEITDRGFSKWVREHLARDEFVVWVHPEGRVDYADEAAVCWDWPKYRAYPMREQVETYRSAGMPRGWGLFAGGTVGWVFTDRVKAFGERWYEEQTRWSIQDQVSLPFLLWDSGLPFGVWRANEYENPYVRLRWDERPRPQD